MTNGEDHRDRRVRELEAIGRIASTFTFELSLEAMMDEVAREVVQANEGSVACLVGEGNRETKLIERVLGSFGAAPGFIEVVELAWRTAGTPLVSSSLQMRKTQVFGLADVLQRPGYEDVREGQRRAGWASMAVVPMVYREEALGLIFVFYPAGYLPDEPELAFLESIGNQVAIAIENARLFEQAQDAAVAEERLRLSRELHDSVSQALYAISLNAQVARNHLESNPARSQEPLDYVVALAKQALGEMRTMIFDLRPEVLASEGLVVALERQAATLRTRGQVAVATSIGSEPELPIQAKEAMYRVAQEALQNVVKHAQATEIWLSLVVGPEVVLEVRDNGRGFAPDQEFPGHLGLTSMRERARRAGGTLTLESAPGAGSIVRFSLQRR